MVGRFLKDGVAYIGWGDVGPVVPTNRKEDIRRCLDRLLAHVLPVLMDATYQSN